MKLFLIGASGNIGTCIQTEALSRGHEITAMTRSAAKIAPAEGLTIHEGDVMDRAPLAQAMKGHDAVIVSHGSRADDPKIGPKTTMAADSILDALREAGVSRVLWVGGAGSLFTAGGKRVVDTMELEPWARSTIWAMAAHYMHLQTITDLDWTFFSPPVGIAPGERTGKFRLGLDHHIVDENGAGRISYADYSIAVIDEIENPRHVRQRFTIGY